MFKNIFIFSIFSIKSVKIHLSILVSLFIHIYTLENNFFFYMSSNQSFRFRNVDVICVWEGKWIIWQYRSNIFMFLFFKLITFSWAKFQWWSSKTIKTEIIANQRRWVNKAYNVKIPIWGKIRYYKIKILTNLIFKKRM